MTNEFSSFAVKNIRPQVGRSLAQAYNLLKDSTGSFSGTLGEGFRQTVAGNLAHKNMTESAMLSSHKAQTSLRCAAADGAYVVVAQDTTSFNYSGQKAMKNLGYLQGDFRGLYQHNALCISESGIPLGVIHQAYWSRESPTKSYKEGEKESQKWFHALESVNKFAKDITKTFVVTTDREADILAYFKAERAPNVELIARVFEPRNYALLPLLDHKNVENTLTLNDSERALMAKLPEMSAALPMYARKEIEVLRNNRYQILVLEIQKTAVEVHPNKTKRAKIDSAKGLNLVIAREVSAHDAVTKQEIPTAKEDRACWYLLTSLPIDTLEQVCRICTFYGLRWRIERFHFTLKSGGYDVETLQFDDLETTINALIFYSIMAWERLALTYAVRENPDLDVYLMFTPQEVEALQAVVQPTKTIKTIRDFTLAMATLVGFVPTKRIPMPGVKRLTQAIERFHYIKKGFAAARVRSA